MSRIFLCAGRHIGLPLAVVLSMCPPAPAGAAGLNDTGLLDCYSASGLVSCADVNALPRQDSFHGRDAAYATGLLVKIGGGAAGFDFTKVCANGDVEGSGSCPLNPAANSGANPGPTEWACTRDNVTGLIWLLESSSGGSWVSYSASATTARCGLASGWRMPTARELLSIVHNGAADGAVMIDADYFPATQNNYYWAAEIDATNSNDAWMVGFVPGGGTAGLNTKTDLGFPTRLVHDAP